MRSWLKAVPLVPLVPLVLMLAFTSAEATDAKTLTMSGIVRDKSSGQAVEGAKIFLIGNKAKGDTTTDSEGTFSLILEQGVQEGSLVRIRIENPGYVPFEKLVPVSSAIPL